MDKPNSGNPHQPLDVKSCEYNNHLEKQHGVIFGGKDIKVAGKTKKEPDYENENAEPEIAKTDADTVKELVEMKFLSKKTKMRLKTHKNRFFSRKYQVLTEEVL